MSDWLVTGAAGMLGSEIVRTARAAGLRVSAPDRATLDICDPRAVSEAVRGHGVVINCAAFTAVDDAESRESEAFSVNAVGAACVASASREHGARLIHISTDYVFDGEADLPYPWHARLNPRTAYGRTKAAGEWAVTAIGAATIVRTAWLYGNGGPNFVSTMARLASAGEPVRVVTDQVGQPTWTHDVAQQILALVQSQAPTGTYHVTNAGQTSWFAFARAIFAELGYDPALVLPTTSAEFGRPAPRPAWSVLSHDTSHAAGLPVMRAWEQALKEAIRASDIARTASVDQ